jgi:hypothetical protein
LNLIGCKSNTRKAGRLQLKKQCIYEARFLILISITSFQKITLSFIENSFVLGRQEKFSFISTEYRPWRTQATNPSILKAQIKPSLCKPNADLY